MPGMEDLENVTPVRRKVGGDRVQMVEEGVQVVEVGDRVAHREHEIETPIESELAHVSLVDRERNPAQRRLLPREFTHRPREIQGRCGDAPPRDFNGMGGRATGELQHRGRSTSRRLLEMRKQAIALCHRVPVAEGDVIEEGPVVDDQRSSTQCSRKRSASRAAIQPVPAAVMACR